MKVPSGKKILLAPLDWGLGHTTRCIPLARWLMARNATVFFAGNQAQRSFFQKALPEVKSLPLAGYGVTYSRRRAAFMPHLLAQLPRLFKTIYTEHRWLLKMAEEHSFDGIISDNRYGLWHPSTPSVFLTHQPGLKTGLGGFADRYFALLHQKMMARFSEVWLADVAGDDNLSGHLAHPSFLPGNARYIGLLSQFEKQISEDEKNGLLVLLSGPEPQRSLLSEMLWQEVQHFAGKVFFVEGSVTATEQKPTGNIQWFSRLNANELQPLMQSAQYVIARSGYSTLMDAAVLDLKLLLIPTPGQTEQEYLGKWLLRQQKALCYRQETFSLQTALKEAADFPFLPLGSPADAAQFVPVLSRWYESL